MINNFYRYKIIEAENQAYGTLDVESGSWSGYINDIIQKRADIIVGDLDITYFRSFVINYLTQIDFEQ